MNRMGLTENGYNNPATDTDLWTVLEAAGDDWERSATIGDRVGMPSNLSGGSANELAKRGLLDRRMVRGRCEYKLTEEGRELLSRYDTTSGPGGDS